LPDRIQKYQRTGYLQWLVPQHVTQSEGDEAREFEIFHGMKPSEVYLLLKAAHTVGVRRRGGHRQGGRDRRELLSGAGGGGRGAAGALQPSGHVPRADPQGIGPRRDGVPAARAALDDRGRATPCKLIEFDRASFSEMLEAQLTAPYKLLQNMATILAQRLYSLDQVHQKVLEQHGAIG